MRSQRPIPGDILAIETADGRIHVQYLGQHPTYGDAVRVFPGVTSADAIVIGATQPGYIAFYPARLAVRERLASVVGRGPAPEVPSRTRRPGARSGRQVVTWVIEGPGERRVVRALSGEERQIPIGAIWNHAYLMQRVLEGWRPDQE